MDPSSGPQSRAPSIMNSPTLARVERARIRLEAQAMNNNENHSLERRILDPKQNSSLIGRIPLVDSMSSGPIKRGLLWQQRDRIFSRWKERYFVLTRDYLHCFKRATGSINERISDMGQFIFKIKLVDVEKVEWLNRRSYSAISLFLGREGRVLLRTDAGLEDWFELLEECTLISKERRHALRITQGPRSRASIAACHSSFQTPHSSLGATYNFQLCDSVPDLTCASSGGGIGGGFTDSNSLSVLTNHHSLMSSSAAAVAMMASSSAPRKISTRNGFSSYHSSNNTNGSVATINTNTSNTTCSSITNNNNHHHNNNKNNNNINNNNNTNNNNNFMNGYSTPLRMQNHHQQQQQKKSVAVAAVISSSPSVNANPTATIDYDNDDNVVQLRRRNASLLNKVISYENGANDKLNDWMYRRPTAPNDIRHSLLTEIDVSACDSGLDTPPSTHRPSSYREPYYMMHSAARDSTDTGVSSSRGTLISPKGSIRTNSENGNALRRSVEESLQQFRNEKNRHLIQSSPQNKFESKLIANDVYDPNQNKYHSNYDNGHISTITTNHSNSLSSSITNINHGTCNAQQQHSPYHHAVQKQQLQLQQPPQHLHHHIQMHGNDRFSTGNNNLNGMMMMNSNKSAVNVNANGLSSGVLHPALLNIINEAQGLKFRDRSFSDIQQKPRPFHQPPNNSSSPRRRQILTTQSRI